MFETLIHKTDEELTELLENRGAGKTPVYRPFARKVLAHVGEDFQGQVPVKWAEIDNLSAKSNRQSVISGMRNMLKADAADGKAFVRIVDIVAGTDDNLVIVSVRKTPVTQ
jgi:hypothetical protein